MKNFRKLILIFAFIQFLTGFSFGQVSLDVVSYGGAVPDDKTDDREAIQKTFDAVNAAGGGVVTFPEGTFLITAPNKGEWEPQLKLFNHLKLRGAGMYKTVIKIADNQGAYDVLFSGKSITGFSMMDICLDGNGSSNPLQTTDDAVKSPFLHSLVYLPDSKDISIQRCRFTNMSGVWAIYALHRAEILLIDGCLFDNIGGFTKNDWDHSCIRIDGFGPIVISNNSFASHYGSGTTGARTAVETHGSNIKFSDNYISGFRYGLNVCSGGDGKTDEPSIHQYYSDNRLVNVGTGFCIWGIENSKFDDLVFERNDITIDATGWKDFYPDFSGIEIVSYNAQMPPQLIDAMRISDNKITYLNSEGGTSRSFGIKLDFGIFDPQTNDWKINPKGKLENVQILRNTISRAFWTGIYINALSRNITISENVIIQPAFGCDQKEWQCAIKFSNSVENLSVSRNRFYTENPSNLSSVIYDQASNLGNCSYFENITSGTAGNEIPFYKAGLKRSGKTWITSQQDGK